MTDLDDFVKLNKDEPGLGVKNNLKRDEILRRLSAYFISLEPGSEIETVRAIAASMQVSTGIISEVITLLEELGAIRIERRGKLGSYLIDQSASLLWKTAIQEPLVIAHTLPSNRRYEGLAAALKEVFQQAGIEIFFTFIRGSCTRLKALRNRSCHVAIMSQFAAEGMLGESENMAVVLNAGSFVKAHRLYIRSDLEGNKACLSAAIDPDSYDQMHISQIEFKNRSIQYKKITFMNIHRYLDEKEVDMAVWTEEDMQGFLSSQIVMRKLSDTTEKILDRRNTKAALVVRSDDFATEQLIKKTIVNNALSSIQQEVIKGKRIPEY